MRVLFVEDDPMNRRVVRDMLSVAGVEMSEAENAEIGLRMLDEHGFDLVLMDLRMPGMDGMTAIRHIRARTDELSRLPIIVVTADTALNLRDECRVSGANDFLQKPIALNSLFDSIGKLIASGECQASLE